MRHMRSRRILAMLLALSMIFGLLTTTALADNEVDQNTSNVGESAANGTSESGSGEGQSSGASDGQPSQETNKKDVPTEEETTPEEKKTTSSEEVDTQAGEGETPVAETTYVASIGEQGYASLDAAIQAAQDNDIIAVSAGEYTLNGSLTYANKAFTIKAADGETVSFDMSAAVALHGAKITFEGVTFDYKTNGNYIGLQHADTLVYNDCTINGMVFLYATNETFNRCTFIQTSADAYNVWTYGAKNVVFNECKFNCVGKSVLVYNEGANAKTDLNVNDTTFYASAPVKGKAAIEIDTSLMTEGGATITVDAGTTATGFSEGSNSGDTLWNDKKQTAETNKNTTVTVADETVFAPKSEGVAKVGNETFDTLDAAFAALNSTNHTLELLDENAWTGENVYWAAGEQSGYEATLAEALTAAYVANADDITIICRPKADVGTMTHSHVADNLTIYGNDAYISGGECDLEVDTYKFSRETGKQDNDRGEYLTGDITITAYELDNLGVWGQRNTNNTVNVNLTDCDTVHGITVQRVYISGTTGMNNITLSGCDFVTKATSVYSNADGEINITDCSFTGAQVPVNFNHKADGAQTVTVTNSTFTSCGDNGDWKQFAAPVRFVNSGSGSQTATVDTCTFAGTVGTNGDILIGDGRLNQQSNNVSLTVTNTEATVMAQKPGYYTSDGTTDDTLKGKKTLTASESLTNASIDSLIGGSTETTKVAKVGDTEYETLAQAIAAADENSTVTLLNDTTEDVTIDKNITLDLGGKTLTNTGAGKATITIAKDATATVKNGSVVGGTSYYNIQNNGTATFEGLTATAGNDGSSMIDNYGTLTITSGEYTGGLDTIKNEPNAKLTVDGGTFTLTKGTGDGFTGVIFNYGELTINDGMFIQSEKTSQYGYAQVIYTDKYGSNVPSTVIKGGTFKNLHTKSTAWVVRASNAAVDATKVFGGSFSKSIREDYCADGFIPTKNADGTYGVKEGKYVAKIGSTGYETLTAAIAKANSKSKPVTLVADVTESIEIAESKTCKIDLNGFTLTNTEGSHTIVNNGTLTIKDGSEAKSGKVDNVTNARAAIVNYGTMTLEGGTYTRSMENPENNKDSGGGNSFYTILNDKGGSLTIKDGVTVTNVGHFSSMIRNGGNDKESTLIIEGGTFSGGLNTVKNDAFGNLTISGGSFSNTTQCVVMNWHKANITGGTFKLGENVNSTLLFSVAYTNPECTSGQMTISGGTFKYTETQGLVQDTFSNGKYTGTLAVSGGTFDCAVDPKYCAEGFEPTKNVDGTFGVKEISAAKIGNVEYETLAAAFAAAKDGETIVLLKNSSGDGIVVKKGTFTGKGLTVDFDGHTYTVGGVLVGSSGTASNGFQLNMDNKITFKNGALYGDASVAGDKTTNWKGAPAILIQNYCDLTLEKMTVVGGKETCYTISNNCGDTLIKNSTITAGEASTKPAYQPARAFDVCGFSTYPGATVTVENSTINGAVEISNGNNSKVALTIGKGTAVSGSLVDGGNGDKVTVTKDNSVDVTAPDGYKWVDGEAGQTLAKIVMVAEVNGTGYETLAEAFAAATDNSTIKLLTDITLEGTTGLKVKAENAMNIVFDLNGHSITGSALSATTPALYIVSACGRDMSGSVKIINSSTEKAAISAKLPLQIFGSSYADEVRVEIDENVTLEVLEGGTNAIKMVQSAAYLVATEHTKTFYKNGGFMTTVNDEERIHEELSSAQKFSKNVKLLNDFATSSYLKIWDSWGAVTLDLDGHTYKSTAKVNMFELQEGANITFKKGTLKGSGDCVIGMPYNNSTLTLDSVAVENTGNFGIATNGTTTNQTVTINNSTIKVPNGMGVYFPSTGKLTINGGSIEANTGVQICAGSLEITGNPTIKATATAAEAISSGSILDGAAVSIVGGRSGYGAMGEVTIDSGSFTSASGIEAVQAYTVDSNNQKADWTDAEAKVNISGGSYSTPVRENLCAEGFVPVTNGDGTYGVQPDGNVAEIGSVKYKSLDEALKAAKDRETVKLLKDVEATQVLVTKGTLDLNGKTLKVSYFMSFSDVIDSTEGNGLIETGVQSFFTTNNSYLPLRDSAANGYRLFSYKLNKLGVVEGSSTAFWFNIIFGGEKAYSLLNTAGHNADLFIPMQIGSENEWQYIKMNQSTLTKWTTPILNGTAPSRCGYYVNITGLNTLTSGTVLTLKTSIRSCGVEKLSDDSLTYTVK